MARSIRSWWLRWTQPLIRSRKQRSQTRRPLGLQRPVLEGLEERMLLSAYSVTSATDSGSGTVNGTLSYGIVQANAGKVSEIDFHIGTVGSARTINLTGALPALTASHVFINGLSQGGSSNTHQLITLAGSGAGSSTNGLQLNGSDDRVSGLLIEHFGGDGIEIQGSNNTIGGTTAGAGNIISGNHLDGVDIKSSASGSLLQGNSIGTNATGTSALANGQNGIGVYGVNSSIGGTVTGARNLISGNVDDGVYVNTGVSGTLVQGNYVGTNVTGTSALGNGTSGISIHGTTNTVGGTTSSARNLISGNTENGVYIETTGTGNLFEGNYIGTDVTGTSALGNGDSGIDILGSSNIVGGASSGARNVISSNGSYGVTVYEGGSNQVLGNYIGTNAAGTSALGNYGGISVSDSTKNSIGSTTTGAGNLISGNSRDGVFIASTASATLLQGNKLGTSAAGTSALTNDYNDIEVSGNNNTIGGTVAGAHNLIAGYANDGVLLYGTGNLVEGNTVGTNAAGTAALGGYYGIEVQGSKNTIGGATTGAGNLISGNAVAGVYIGQNATGVLVQGSTIGTNATGTAALGSLYGIVVSGNTNTIGGTTSGARNLIAGNTLDGVLLYGNDNLVERNTLGSASNSALGSDYGITIDGSGNTVGGTSSAAGNLIAGNSRAGVQLLGRAGNTVRENTIYANGSAHQGPGIVLASTANNSIAAPLLSAAQLSGSTLTVKGTFTAARASVPYVLEVFANASGDPEGKVFLGAVTVTPTTTGTQSFTFTTTTTVTGSDPLITATLTDASGDTSAFSKGVTVS